VPLGHFSWKWNPTREKYQIYEKELLAGILAIGSNFRILGSLPIIWLCDNQATRTFLDQGPPQNARLRRWYTFLCQFKLTIKHVRGDRNEFCDWLSRHEFENLTDTKFDDLTTQAFERMDTQLDFAIFTMKPLLQPEDYSTEPWKSIWNQLPEGITQMVEGNLCCRNNAGLFVEGKAAIPQNKLHEALKWAHHTNGHPGAERTLMFFLKHYFSDLTRKDLMNRCKAITDACEVCIRSKPSSHVDRGLISHLPVPQIANDTIYIDFISMDPCRSEDGPTYNYILTMVDSLTRFVQFVPCTKSISGEETLKLILNHWIRYFDRPNQIVSDNDVRFVQSTGYYQRVLKQMDIKIRFSNPRMPRTNGLCERTNRAFLQNLRAMSLEMKTLDWPKLTPQVTWLMKSQISPKTGYSPSELFLGRPSWKLEIDLTDDNTPTLENFLRDQILLQEAAQRRLTNLRHTANLRANKTRKNPSYKVGDFVLISHERWPHKKLAKIASRWFGPFCVTGVKANTLEVAAGPSNGGQIQVSYEQCKHWNTILDHNEELDHDDDDTMMIDDDDPDDMDITEITQNEPQTDSTSSTQQVASSKGVI